MVGRIRDSFVFYSGRLVLEGFCCWFDSDLHLFPGSRGGGLRVFRVWGLGREGLGLRVLDFGV